MKEKPLKNCVEIDCEDKGDKVEFRVKQLLVRKENLDAFMESRKGGKGEAGNGWSGSASQPGDLKLRRFNVPAQELKNSDDVFAAFRSEEHTSELKSLMRITNA